MIVDDREHGSSSSPFAPSQKGRRSDVGSSGMLIPSAAPMSNLEIAMDDETESIREHTQQKAYQNLRFLKSKDARLIRILSE